MKKIVTLLSFIAISTVSAQEASKKNQFGFYGSYKLGMGTLENNQIGYLSGTLSALEANVYLNAFENTKVGIGVGYLQFQSSFYDGTLNNSLTNSYLHIPMTINHRLSLLKNENETKQLFFVVGLGVYANNLSQSKVKNLEESISLKNQGWNFGNTAEIGFEYLFSNDVHFGLYMQNMNDWKSIKKNGVEQKLVDSNFIKFGVGVNF